MIKKGAAAVLLLLVSILALAPILAKAQPAVVKNILTSGKAGSKKRDGLNFPLVSLPNKAVAKKINDFLQINLLHQLMLKPGDPTLFDKVKWTPDKSGIEMLDYSVVLNTEKVLSLAFDVETIGAHLDSYEVFYQFNLQNGDLILPDDLFSGPALEELKNDLRSKRKVLIASHLKALKKDSSALDWINEVEDNLEQCNVAADPEDFTITHTGLVFHKSHCLPHLIAGLDADLELVYPFKQLRPWLSKFGQQLLTGSGSIKKAVFPSLKKPLRGLLDKYPIVLQLHREEGISVTGFYYYADRGVSIELSGTWDGNKIELQEINEDDEIMAIFKGTVKGTGIAGTWTSLRTKEEHPFAVKN